MLQQEDRVDEEGVGRDRPVTDLTEVEHAEEFAGAMSTPAQMRTLPETSAEQSLPIDHYVSRD